MIIRVKDLRLRTIIGFKEWEREKKQNIVINITIVTDAEAAATTDDISDSIDYKELTKRVISAVEATDFNLLERLADFILDIVMEYALIIEATVEIDKPVALRFADSVSVELTRKR